MKVNAYKDSHHEREKAIFFFRRDHLEACAFKLHVAKMLFGVLKPQISALRPSELRAFSDSESFNF